jgi:hypothetical protein
MLVGTGSYNRAAFYFLEIPTKRQLRPFKWIDDHAVWGLVEGDWVQRITMWTMPSTTMRIRRLVKIMNDRQQCVQIIHHSGWTQGRQRDLSVEVLLNKRQQFIEEAESLSMEALMESIAMRGIDSNEDWTERRQNNYKKLLDAYFIATTNLDILARSEPNCSREVKQLIVDHIAKYANPMRSLLLRIMDAQLRGNYDHLTYSIAIDALIGEWDVSQAVIEADSTFEIEQADRRVQAFLVDKNTIATHN